MIVTVTLNAALDRSLTVPIFKLGHRHRASNVLALAGGKGINVARALKRLDVPVVATGLAGGRTGTRIVEELTEEAILNDFVRIRDESRTSTAVVDPTSGTYTEINEWGPKVSPEELEILLDKLRYLSRGASTVVFAGSLPRGVDEGVLRRCGARDDAARRARRARRGGRAAAARDRGRAVARVAEPARGGAARRPGARGRRRLPDGARHGSPRWAPATSTSRWRPAASRSSARSARCGATAPGRRSSSPSRSLGAGDVLLARWLAAQAEERPAEEALRLAVAAGSASVLEVGAGRFDPKEAARLASLVEVDELQPVGEHEARARRARPGCRPTAAW